MKNYQTHNQISSEVTAEIQGLTTFMENQRTWEMKS